MGHVAIEKLKNLSPKILPMPQGRNYNEVPVQGMCLSFCHLTFKTFFIS